MHEFWNKQPVPQDKVVFEKDGEIDSSRELRYEKTPLPEGYEWSSCTVEELCEHKFMEGTGHNHYYLWNWKMCEEIQPKNIGFVII